MNMSPQGNSITAPQDEVPNACNLVGYPVLLKKKGSKGPFTGPVSIVELDQTINFLGCWEGDQVIVRHAH